MTIKSRLTIKKTIFLLALLFLAGALAPGSWAKIFQVQNESVDMFVVNGSSGNIILNPNAGFGNVGINTTAPTKALHSIGEFNLSAAGTQREVSVNGTCVIIKGETSTLEIC